MNRGDARGVRGPQPRVTELEGLLAAHEKELLGHTARLEESMRELRHKTGILESVLAGMADAVVVADTAGKFLLFNPEAERLLRMRPGGRSRRAVVGTLRLLPARRGHPLSAP